VVSVAVVVVVVVSPFGFVTTTTTSPLVCVVVLVVVHWVPTQGVDFSVTTVVPSAFFSLHVSSLSEILVHVFVAPPEVDTVVTVLPSEYVLTQVVLTSASVLQD
jgi:hypothetical protein